MNIAVISVGVALTAVTASAQVRITEWMYSGNSGEYIEITNISGAPVDLSGWWYDDDSALPGVFSLAPLGVLQPGQSGIITDVTADEFRASWNLAATVAVAGSNTANIGRADQLNIFNGTTLIDRLTYGDQVIPGTIRTQNRSGITTFANLGANNVAGWFFSTVGDTYFTVTSAQGDIGNPGVFVPAPGALGLLAAAGALGLHRRR